jgi:ubiquitin-protein ligase
MSWDPDADAGEPLSKSALKRVQRDLQQIGASENAGILVCIDDKDVRTVHAIVLGPDATPYSFAPFLFRIKFPADYANSSPRVRLLTTHDGDVRMGPNLYAEGKVCLSILGTWTGPGWLPTMTLESTLINLQALLHPDPLILEPGHESDAPDVRASYCVAVEHEVLRVAVLSQVDYTGRAGEAATPEEGAAALKSPPYIDALAHARDFLWDNFESMAETWAARARDLARAHDGKPLGNLSPIAVIHRHAKGGGGVFEFAKIASRIDAVAAAIRAAKSAGAVGAGEDGGGAAGGASENAGGGGGAGGGTTA